MTNPINEKLGIPENNNSRRMKNGFHEIAIVSVEKAEPKKEYGKDIAIKIEYQVGNFTNKYWLSGKYTKDESNTITGAGSCQQIWDLLHILDLTETVKKDGTLDDTILKSYVPQEEASMPTEPDKFKKNVLGYLYKNEDGYWRMFRYILPVDANESEQEKVKHEFDDYVRKGFLNPISNEIQKANQEAKKREEESGQDLPGF